MEKKEDARPIISVEDRLLQIDTLTEYYEAVIDKKDEEWNKDKRNSNKPFEEYWAYISPEKDKIAKLDREKRMIMPYVLNEMPTYGDVMSLADFIESVEDGGFIDYDGHGYYVKDDKASNIMIIPSDVKFNSIRKDFDKVVWFNR